MDGVRTTLAGACTVRMREYQKRAPPETDTQFAFGAQRLTYRLRLAQKSGAWDFGRYSGGSVLHQGGLFHAMLSGSSTRADKVDAVMRTPSFEHHRAYFLRGYLSKVYRAGLQRMRLTRCRRSITREVIAMHRAPDTSRVWCVSNGLI
jgi:hypothetical protein